MIFFLYFLLLFTDTTIWGAGAAGYDPETGKVDEELTAAGGGATVDEEETVAKEETVADGAADRSSTPPPRTTRDTRFHAKHSPFQILQATPPRAREGHVKSKTHDDGEDIDGDVAHQLFPDKTTETPGEPVDGIQQSPSGVKRIHNNLESLSPDGRTATCPTPDSLVVSLQNLFHHIQKNITPISQDTIDAAQIMKENLPADMQKYLDEHQEENIILELPYRHLFEPYFIKDSREIFGFHHDHNNEVEVRGRRYLNFTEKTMYGEYYTTNITYTPNVTVNKKTYSRTTPDTPRSIAAPPLSTATASPTEDVAHVLFPEPSPTEDVAHVLFPEPSPTEDVAHVLYPEPSPTEDVAHVLYPEASTPHKMYTEGSLKGFFPARWTRKKLLEELKNFLHHAVHDTILDTDDSMHFSHQVSDHIVIKIVFVKEGITWRIGTIFPMLSHVLKQKIESARKQEDIKAIAQAAKESKIQQTEKKRQTKHSLQKALSEPKKQMRRLNTELQSKQRDLSALLTGTQIHKEKEIKSLKTEITALTEQIATLEQQIAPIEEQIKAIELIDLKNHVKKQETKLAQKKYELSILKEGFKDKDFVAKIQKLEQEIFDLEKKIKIYKQQIRYLESTHVAGTKISHEEEEGDHGASRSDWKDEAAWAAAAVPISTKDEDTKRRRRNSHSERRGSEEEEGKEESDRLSYLEHYARYLGHELAQKESRLARLRKGLVNEEEGFEDKVAIRSEIAELESQIPPLRARYTFAADAADAARRAHREDADDRDDVDMG